MNAYILTRKKPLLYIREQGSQCPRCQTKATAIYSANLKNTQINDKSKRTVPPTKIASSRSGALTSADSIRNSGENVNKHYADQSKKLA